MLGAVIIVLVLVIAIPVGFLMTMSIVAAVLGWTVGDEVDHTFEPQTSAEQAAERKAEWRRAVQRSLEWAKA